MNALASTDFRSIIESVLPSLSAHGLSYNKDRNIFLTEGYTSAAGNTYFQGLRLSDRIIVDYDFGQGYAYLFLNGIRIYGYNGNSKQLIASRSYYSQCFSESFARRECESMVKEYITAEMKLLNAVPDSAQIEAFSHTLISSISGQKCLG